MTDFNLEHPGAPRVTMETARQNIGRAVVYQSHPGATIEQGVITSVGDRFVFVRYGSDVHSKATHASDLGWMS